MKLVKVRCWEVEDYHDNIIDVLYVTEPESSTGYNLITCLKCGQIYSASLSLQIYCKSIEEILVGVECIKCGDLLNECFHLYPDKYLSTNGRVREYSSDMRCREEQDSTIKEFYEIYSDEYPDDF